MKGKIDGKYGVLSIERAGEMVKCLCAPKCHSESEIACSHTCPAFHEPVKFRDDMTVLELCNVVGTLVFSEFTDERGGE